MVKSLQSVKWKTLFFTKMMGDGYAVRQVTEKSMLLLQGRFQVFLKQNMQLEF